MKTIVSAVIQKTGSNRNGSLETNTTDSAVTEKVSDPPVIQRTGSNQKGSSENNTEKQINTEIQDSPTTPNTVADVKNPTNGSKTLNGFEYSSRKLVTETAWNPHNFDTDKSIPMGNAVDTLVQY